MAGSSKVFSVKAEGYTQVDGSIRRFKNVISKTTGNILAEEAARADAVAKMLTPFKTGKLESQTMVTKEGLRVVGKSSAINAGYDYAGIQHDTDWYHHPVKGEAHYLESAFDEMIGRIHKRSNVELKYD